VEGALGVGGRKVPFISPIPSKNSSLSSACHFAKTRLLTWNDLEQVWAITPYILSVVYDDHHTLIRREQSLQVLGGEICSSAWLLHRKRSRGLTSTLISTQYPVPKDLALWVDHSADRIGISPSSHCINVHLVEFRHGHQEILQSGPIHQYLSPTLRMTPKCSPWLGIVVSFRLFPFPPLTLSWSGIIGKCEPSNILQCFGIGIRFSSAFPFNRSGRWWWW